MSDDKLKYEMKVTSIGPLVKEFVDAGILVFFGPEIPEELVEFSIVHEHGPLRSEVAPGDLILIDDEPFEVLAVG
ncbi:MAG TPA: PTS sorbitol transporter subunit IIA, partial [Chloroflexi bacterium]|nr:PTS sorbitol transporter subunit IIA [Chloroflexota bacterium]